MNPSSLSYHLALDRQRELVEEAERSRRSRSAPRRMAVGTAKASRRRRRALRRALLGGALGRVTPERS
jgi:DNA-binding transcriptional ArsR family regulator